jgi:hypothetical protein
MLTSIIISAMEYWIVFIMGMMGHIDLMEILGDFDLMDKYLAQLKKARIGLVHV